MRLTNPDLRSLSHGSSVRLPRPAVAVPKRARLGELIHKPQLTFPVEAPNGLSTRIVEEAGFQAIWANHIMRPCITARQNLAKIIFAKQSLIQIEGSVEPISEVFRLQGAEERATDVKAIAFNVDTNWQS